MNFGLKHAPSAGSITRLIVLQSNALPLCYDCALYRITNTILLLASIILVQCVYIFGLNNAFAAYLLFHVYIHFAGVFIDLLLELF